MESYAYNGPLLQPLELVWNPHACMPNMEHFVLRPICGIPKMFIVYNFLSHEECDMLVAEARDRMEISTVVDKDSGETYTHPGRTSSGMFFKIAETDLVTTIEKRIEALTYIPMVNGEGMQMLNYKPNQFYKPHYDYFDPALSGSAVHLQHGGQRVATLLMYLNDVEGSGETALPNIGIKVNPTKGSAFLFFNCYEDGTPNLDTLHSSEPVSAGEKWVATKWLRERAYNTYL